MFPRSEIESMMESMYFESLGGVTFSISQRIAIF
jgi:hypothetical protein